MTKVFISYRRSDSAYVTHDIYEKLVEHYGSESVVFDVDAIPLGWDFVEYLNEQVSECDVLLAVIGDRWLDAVNPEGKRRLDDPNDFVRVEIQAALERRIPVVPVLVENASMPRAGQLPDVIRGLSRRNAAEVRAGRDFKNHLERLVRGVDATLKRFSERAALKKRAPHDSPVSPGSPSTSDPADSQSLVADTVDVNIKKPSGMAFKLVSPGTFSMGAGSERYEVTLTEPFYLGVYPVTQGEYHRVMGENPSSFKGDDNQPVENVSWFDAIEFCNRLSESEGLPRYYDGKGQNIQGGVGYRLPTEAEWEFACRAGNTGAYCFGDDEGLLGQYAWYLENSDDTTHPVGEKRPNAWGFYDMHGNVWEWCWDWYDDYPTTPQEDPTGSPDGVGRVFRGGCWHASAGSCRSACRSRVEPGYRYGSLGFRVARSSG